MVKVASVVPVSLAMSSSMVSPVAAVSVVAATSSDDLEGGRRR